MAIPGVQTATWGTMAFAKWITSARDNFGPSFFAHRIPHRNGALQEQTGNIPFKVTYGLEFAGLTWADDAKRVLGAFVAKPRNDLVHHLRGKVRAVVQPIDATWDPVNKGNHLAATVTFEEDTLTNNASFDRTPGTVGDDIAQSTGAADSNASLFVSDVFGKFKVGIPALRMRTLAESAQTSTTTFTTATRSFAAAALSQYQAGQLQPSLAAQLGRLAPMVDAVATSFRLMPPVSPYAQVTIDNVEISLNQARQLEKAIRANLPPPIRWTVSQQTTLHVLVGRLYPTRTRDEKFAIATQIQLQNGLTRPDALPAGKQIIIPAP